MAILKLLGTLSGWSKGFMHAIAPRCREKMAIITRKEGRRFLPVRESQGLPRRFMVKWSPSEIILMDGDQKL